MYVLISFLTGYWETLLPLFMYEENKFSRNYYRSKVVISVEDFSAPPFIFWMENKELENFCFVCLPTLPPFFYPPTGSVSHLRMRLTSYLFANQHIVRINVCMSWFLSSLVTEKLFFPSLCMKKTNGAEITLTYQASCVKCDNERDFCTCPPKRPRGRTSKNNKTCCRAEGEEEVENTSTGTWTCSDTSTRSSETDWKCRNFVSYCVVF